jgi:hypothetical protein
VGFSILIATGAFTQCSNHALIRRVNKKGDVPHYRIDGNYNLRHNSNCLLNKCSGNTTVWRKILILPRPSPTFPGTRKANTKGATVSNYLKVNTSIGVCKIYAKRVLRDATGLTKGAFREAFTKIDYLMNYLTTILQMRLALLSTCVTMSIWENARVVERIGSLLELHVSMLWRYGRGINLN